MELGWATSHHCDTGLPPISTFFQKKQDKSSSHSSESLPPTAAAGTGPTPKRLHFPTALEEQAALTQGMSALAMTPSQPDDIAAEEQHPAFEVDYF